MANDVVIRAEGLGKKYVIGHQSHERNATLRDALVRSTRRLLRTSGDMLHGRPIYAGDEVEEFWALQGISFEVMRGEAIGIIGRNGAGKSTLLKILSRITEPSTGRVELSGRIASLLEVGTGFHPELTGRENIYLNGAILGMARAEIRNKFDEIVAFADVERFLDTPVKRYSSGMYMRLAFSVAAHLEPEILIVDEVLAVGDIAFQNRCLGKMQEVVSQGRTILFVSHNMGAIRKFCQRGILVEDGRKALDDTVESVIAEYSNRSKQALAIGRLRKRGCVAVNPNAVIRSCTAKLEPNLNCETDLVIRVDCEPSRSLARVGVGISIKDLSGMFICRAAPVRTACVIPEFDCACRVTFRARNINRFLCGGVYVVDVWLAVPGFDLLTKVEDAAFFEVRGEDLYETGHITQNEIHGPVPLKFNFLFEPSDAESDR